MRPTGAAVVAACAVLLSACTLPFLGTPSAAEILAKPSRADVRDAHFTVSGTPGAGTTNLEVRGEGDIVFKPEPAMRLTETTSIGATRTTVDILSVDGIVYQRLGGAEWGRVPANVQSASFSAWSGAAGPTYVGEETIAGSRCWHVAASYGSAPLDLWVRQSDGYPIRAKVGQLVVDYGRFNSGIKIAAPAAGEIRPQPRIVTARVGERVELDGVELTVDSVDPNHQPADRSLRPAAGNRLVLVRITYLRTGGERVTYGSLQWRLTDSTGATFPTALSDRGPQLGYGDLTAPGQKVSGYVSYEVPAAAAGLQLRGTIGEDAITVGV